MDRTSFLASMPFLEPLSLSEWPPRATREGSRVELSFESHTFQVSVEPVHMETMEILPPAFFAATKEDPAMCEFQVAVEYEMRLSQSATPLPQTPSSSSSVRSIWQIQNNRTKQQQKTPLAVYFKLGRDSVYRVHVSQLVAVELRNEEGKRAGTAAVNQTASQDSHEEQEDSSLPASLLIVFPICVFRVFSLVRGDEDASKDKTLLSQLDAIRGTLLDASASIEAPTSLQIAVAGTTSSPATTGTSSGSSAREAGQRDTSPKATIGGPSATTDNAESGSATGGGGGVEKRIKRRRITYWQSQHGLRALQQILEMTVPLGMASSGKDSTNRMNNVKDGHLHPEIADNNLPTMASRTPTTTTTRRGWASPRKLLPHLNSQADSKLPSVAPLLTACAEDLASSYGGYGRENEIYQRQLDFCRQSMDESLKSFFPPPKSTRTKQNSSYGSLNEDNQGKQQAVLEELLIQHRRIVQAMHQTSSLPSRG